MKLTKQRLRQIIREEAKEIDWDETSFPRDNGDDVADDDDKVKVTNTESSNTYKVRKQHARKYPNKYSNIREAVRTILRNELNEARDIMTALDYDEREAFKRCKYEVLGVFHDANREVVRSINSCLRDLPRHQQQNVREYLAKYFEDMGWEPWTNEWNN